MSDLIFPENPVVGQGFTATNNVVYEWNGITWIVIGGGNQGNYFLPTASTSILGGVKVDGSTITIDGSGVIHGSSVTNVETLEDVAVNLSTLVNWQTLVYNGMFWANGYTDKLANGGNTVSLSSNGTLTLPDGKSTLSTAGEFRIWSTDTDITVYRNGQDGYGIKSGEVDVYASNVKITKTTASGLELLYGNFKGNGSQLTNLNYNNISNPPTIPTPIPSGGIIMWSGSVGSIPAGWALCDGTNSTPDLRDTFIVGAGGAYTVGANGGSKDSTLVSHNHTASTSISDPGHAHWISGAAVDDRNFSGTGNNNQEYGLVSDAGSYSNQDPNHSYGRYSLGNSTGISASTSVNTVGSSGLGANLPPYYALCYIMKT